MQIYSIVTLCGSVTHTCTHTHTCIHTDAQLWPQCNLRQEYSGNWGQQQNHYNCSFCMFRIKIYYVQLRMLHLNTHYSMQQCTNCNSTSSYKTTNHMHNDIHGCPSVCWLYVNCTHDHASAFLDKTRYQNGPKFRFLVACARLQSRAFPNTCIQHAKQYHI